MTYVPPPRDLKRDFAIAQDYVAGDSLRTIAIRHGISYERVRQVLARVSVKRRPRGARKAERP